MTQWLVAKTVNVYDGKREYKIEERPLLHACCNQDHFGDVNVDFRPEVNPDFVCDVTKPLPFRKEQFKSSFADVPWVNSWKWNLGKCIRELLKVSEVCYIISPWIYGWRGCMPEIVEVSRRPGINSPILFVKYTKTEKFWPEVEKSEELTS